MKIQLKNQLRRLLPNNSFARSVSVLIGGTASAQLLLVLAAPLLTRLYSTADFGLLAVYGSLLGLLGVIASLRYELAIPLPEDDDQAAHLVALSCLLVLLMTTLAAMLVWFAAGPLTQALGAPQLAAYLWLLPIGILFSGTYTVFKYWALRTKAFTAVAGTTLQQSIATLLIQVAGYKLGPVCLLIGQAAGHGAGTLNLGLKFFKSEHRKRLSWQVLWQQAVRHKRFPIFSSWEALFNTAGVQMPPLLLAAFFSPAAAGVYSLANRVLSLPMMLIGSAIAQVFFSNAAQAHREGHLGKLVAELHAKLAHVGLPPVLLLFLVGPDLFAFVFGSDWRQAGEFARWMTPWLYLVFVSSPLSTLFAVMEQQKRGLAFQAILLTTRVGALLIGALTGDLITTVILFSSTSALCWLGFLLWVGKNTGNSTFMLLKQLPEAMAYAVAFNLPLTAIVFWSAADTNAWLYGLASSIALITARVLYIIRKNR